MLLAGTGSVRIVNKQLFLFEIVFRFQKDIGNPRRPGLRYILHEKYRGVQDLLSHVTVITVAKYFPSFVEGTVVHV